ncbi:LamG domain-containing protein [Candidatus Gottesmanbacteria bacterium]|nr:LamG domain-containing protein [Candidatus Gottesmanbacteria bacterium]
MAYKILVKTARHIACALFRPKIILLLILVISLSFATVSLIRLVTAKNTSVVKKSLLSNRFTIHHASGDLTSRLEAKKQDVSLTVSRGNASATFAMAVSAVNTAHTKDEIVYTVKDGLRMRYQPIQNGIKEEIILDKPMGRSTFLSTLSVANVRPIVTPEGQIVFVDQNGTYQFHVMQPFAVDANGTITRNIRYRLTDAADVYKKLSKDINQHTYISQQLLGPIPKMSGPGVAERSYMLVLDMDPAWLTDPVRAYPITIDPTVVHDTTTEFATGQLNRVKDIGSGSSPILETYYQEALTDSRTVGLWHMNNTWSDSSGNGNTGTAQGNATFTTSSLIGSHAGVFDGLDDSVQIADNVSTSITGSGLTLAAWVYLDAGETTAGIIHKGTHYSMYINANQLTYADSINYSYANNGYYGSIPNQVWTHIAVTFNGYARQMYINGVLVGTNNSYPGSITDKAIPLLLGCYDDTGAGGATCSDGASFDGMMDDVLIKNAALAPKQIKNLASRRPSSTYMSEIIDLTSGTSTLAAWNSLSWTELGVTTGDGETPKDSTGLVAQWNFNETSGTTADNAEGTATLDGTLTGFDSTASQDADPDSGWTANNRRWGGGALKFDGIDSSIAVPNDSTLNPSTAITLEAWYKTDSVATIQNIIDKRNAADGTVNYLMQIPTTGLLRFYSTGPVLDMYSVSALPLGQWNHIVMTYDSSTANIYINGKLDKSGSYSGNLSTTVDNSLKLCRHGSTAQYYCNGTLDSTRIYSRALTPTEILSNYNAGNIELQTRVGADSSPDDGSWEAWRPVTAETAIASMDSDAANWAWDNTATYMPQSKSDNSVIKTEGSGTMKLTTGILQADANTVGLWHMEETGGTGAYIKDASSNTRDGTPTGTTLVNGISGKARNFNGTSDYIRVPAGAGTSLDLDVNPVTMEAWIKLDTTTNNQMIIARGDYGTEGYGLRFNNTTGKLNLGSHGGSNFDSITPINTGQWYHVAGVINNTTSYLYINGKLDQTGTVNIVASNLDFYIGADYDVAAQIYFFDGTIDEVRISNVARSAEEIAESYRAGRDHYLNKTISSTDVSGKTSLPFSIAADRPGTYLETTIGESAYANYQSDANTAALWHLDENNQVMEETFPGTTLATAWTETDPNANKIAVSNGLVLTAGTVAGWDSAIVSNNSFTRAQGLTAYMKFTTSTGVAAPNHMMFGLANNATTASYTNVTHALYFNAGAFYVYQDGVLFGGPYGSGYTTSTTYEVKVALTANGTATYSVKGGVYTDWTTLLATDGTKTNTPLRVQVAQYQHTGTVNEISVYTPVASIKDASSNATHGTTGGNNIAVGQIGQAQQFNGTSDFISIVDANSLDITANITLEAWIKTDVLTGFQTIVGKRDVSAAEYNYALRTNGDELEFYFIGSAATQVATTSVSNLLTNKWYHVALTYNSSTPIFYVNGIAQSSSCTTGTCNMAMTADNNPVSIGRPGDLNSQYFNGTIDEVRISTVVRSADEIRQAYEAGLRAHPITIDFGAKLDSGNLITGSSDLSFTVDATALGLSSMGSNLYLGDKIIVRENYDGTEYIAQGTVTAVTASTGAVTVASWDTGSTFPSGGYTANASVFKWQREYWNITEPLDSHINAATVLTLRLTDGSEGRTVWLDDFRSAGDYLTTPGGSTITSSTGNRYFQYRAVLHSSDEAVTPQLTSVTLDYRTNVAPSAPTTILTEGAANPTNVIDTTPEFSAIYVDADSGDIANKYRLQVDDNSNFSSILWDSGAAGTSMANCIAGNRCADISYAGSALTLGATYYIRFAFWDDDNTEGAWSSESASFIMNAAQSTPTLDSPTNGATNRILTVSLKTTGTDIDGDYLRYKIELCTNSGMTANCQTFDQTVSQTGWSGQNAQVSTAYNSGSQATYTIQTPLTISTTYYWRSYSTDPGGTNTWSSTQGAPFSFTTTDGTTNFNMEGLQLEGINLN